MSAKVLILGGGFGGWVAANDIRNGLPEDCRVTVVDRIDPQRREAVVGGETVSGDYLVIALGAEPAPETIPGLRDAGHNFYTLSGADALRRAMADFSGGRLVIVTAAPGYKCPAAPYEAAMLLEHFCRSHGVRDKTRIELYAAEPGPMPRAVGSVSPTASRRATTFSATFRPTAPRERCANRRSSGRADGWGWTVTPWPRSSTASTHWGMSRRSR